MGYTIETKPSADVESDVLTTEKYFAVADVQRQTMSTPAVSQNQPEVYFQMED
jgi:hypothetical protein